MYGDMNKLTKEFWKYSGSYRYVINHDMILDSGYIFCRSINGDIYSIPYNNTMTRSDIFDEVANKLNNNVDEFRLVYGGFQLKNDNKLLIDCGIYNS
jgi:hypothetical protein